MYWFEKRECLPERLQYSKPCIMDEEKLSISQRQFEVDALYRLGIKYRGTTSCWKYFVLVFSSLSPIYTTIYINIYMNPHNQQLSRAHLLRDNLI